MHTLQCGNDPKEWRLLLTPYLLPPPKISLRFNQLIDNDSNEDSVHIPGPTAYEPLSESGVSEVLSDYDAPTQTDDINDDSLHLAVDASDGTLSDDEGVHDMYIAQNVFRDRWNTTHGDKHVLMGMGPIVTQIWKIQLWMLMMRMKTRAMLTGLPLRLNLVFQLGPSLEKVLSRMLQRLVCLNINGITKLSS
jgi:hypothetical protein